MFWRIGDRVKNFAIRMVCGKKFLRVVNVIPLSAVKKGTYVLEDRRSCKEFCYKNG